MAFCQLLVSKMHCENIGLELTAPASVRFYTYPCSFMTNQGITSVSGFANSSRLSITGAENLTLLNGRGTEGGMGLILFLLLPTALFCFLSVQLLTLT